MNKDESFLNQIRARGMNTPEDVICTFDRLTKENDAFREISKSYKELEADLVEVEGAVADLMKVNDRLREVSLNETTGAYAYIRHYYGSQSPPNSVINLLSRLEKVRLEALKD